MEAEIKECAQCVTEVQLYKFVIKSAIKKAAEINIEELSVEDKTLQLIGLIASSVSNTQHKAIKVRRGFREIVEVKEAYAFVAFLYFDYSSEFVSTLLNVSRSSVHHYCRNVIAKYQIYPDYKDKFLKFFSKEDMDDMIKKFEEQRRSINGDQEES